MRIIGAIVNKLVECADNYRLENQLKGLHCGKNVRIGKKTEIIFSQNIFIGDNTYINGGMIKASPNAKITIGLDCLLSYNIHLRTDMHCYKKQEVKIQNQGIMEKDIIIEDDCWIGYGVQILPGVKISKGCVIGAGAVVTHSTEPYCVYGGVPARKIGERHEIKK